MERGDTVIGPAVSAVEGARRDEDSRREEWARRDEELQRQEVERQELIMISLLRHDTQTIGDAQRIDQGRFLVSVALSKGKAMANTKFTLAQGAASRWFVQEIDLKPLQNAGFGGKAPAK